MNMKKTLILTLLMSILPSLVNAERYICSYLFNGEPNSIVYDRKVSTFLESNGAEDEIIFEDSDTIVLNSTYSFLGSNTESPSTFTTLIDKKRLTFVFIGLQYKKNSGIAQGKCKVTR